MCRRLDDKDTSYDPCLWSIYNMSPFVVAAVDSKFHFSSRHYRRRGPALKQLSKICPAADPAVLEFHYDRAAQMFSQYLNLLANYYNGLFHPTKDRVCQNKPRRVFTNIRTCNDYLIHTLENKHEHIPRSLESLKANESDMYAPHNAPVRIVRRYLFDTFGDFDDEDDKFRPLFQS